MIKNHYMTYMNHDEPFVFDYNRRRHHVFINSEEYIMILLSNSWMNKKAIHIIQLQFPHSIQYASFVDAIILVVCT